MTYFISKSLGEYSEKGILKCYNDIFLNNRIENFGFAPLI